MKSNWGLAGGLRRGGKSKHLWQRDLYLPGSRTGDVFCIETILGMIGGVLVGGRSSVTKVKRRINFLLNFSHCLFLQ